MIGRSSTKGRNRITLPLGLLAVALAACSPESMMGPGNGTPVARIEITGAATWTSLGQVQELSATAYDDAGNALPGTPLLWTIEGSGVVVPETTGRLRSVGNGTAVVVVRPAAGVPTVLPEGYSSGQGVEGRLPVTVSQLPVSLQLVPGSGTLWAVGQRGQWVARRMDALGNPITGSIAATWSSDDAGVAAVDGDGVVRAVADGIARIVARWQELVGETSVAVSATIGYRPCFTFAFGGVTANGNRCSRVDLVVRDDGALPMSPERPLVAESDAAKPPVAQGEDR